MGDEYFSSVDALLQDQKTTCEKSMKKKIVEIYTAFYNSNKEKRSTVSCAARDFEGKTYENLVLKADAMDKVQSGWKFWNYYQKGSKKDALNEEVKKIQDRSIIRCKSSEDFGRIFDEFFDKNDQKTSKFDGDLEYCVRDYLVSRKLVSNSSFEFVLNPRNVRTELINCNEKVNELLDYSYKNKTMVPSKNDCEMKAYREMNFMDYMLKGNLLSQLKLTNSDKNTEKQNFINTMIDITYKIKSCQ
ncbi:unnamed protein product [Diamesa tonsa]